MKFLFFIKFKNQAIDAENSRENHQILFKKEDNFFLPHVFLLHSNRNNYDELYIFLHSLFFLRVSLKTSIYKCWIARLGNESREREENVWNIIKCNFWAEPTRESDWMLIMTIKITMVTQHTYSACRYNFINFASPLNADVTKFFDTFLCFREC